MIAIEQWRQDLRYAARSLRRTPAFTLTVMLTLAVGIAGTTMMFALVGGVLLRPLPVYEQDDVIVAWKEVRSTGFGHVPFDEDELRAVREESEIIESAGGVDFRGAWRWVALENGTASFLMGAPVTGDFFDVLGVEPQYGRTLHAGDDVAGAEPVLVISHGLWQRRYGGSRTVLGRTLALRERTYTIVGVLPPGFEYPRGADAWMTVGAVNVAVEDRRFRPLLDLVGRVRSGATAELAMAELDGIVRRSEAQQPSGLARGQTPVIRSFEDVVVGDVRTPILVLFAAVALVLLIASANVANLLLIRGAARRPELAVRAALGAGRSRLARQVLAEGFVLAFGAAAIGLAATWFALQSLLALVPDGLPRIESVRIDPVVIAFTAAIAFVSAATAAVLPALATGRADLSTHLRRGGRGTIGSLRHGRRVLVVAQVALAVTVIAAAGLLTRSMLRLQTVDMGLARDRLVFVQLSVPQAVADEVPRHFQFLDNLVSHLENAPGIAAVTPVQVMPFSGTGGWDAPQFTAEGQSSERAAQNPALNLEGIDANYFRTFDIALLRGRAFTREDREGSVPVAIVSEDVANETWPGDDPIGKRVKLGSPDSQSEWRTVVGVAAPVRYRELAGQRATLYVPARQFGIAAHMVVVRTDADPSVVAGAARERIRSIEPDAQVMRVAPFSELLAAPLARPRFSAILISVFAIAALLLAAVGLYGVMSAHVRQRTTEIGIRVALGASARDVRRLVLGEGIRLALVGTGIGIVGAVASARFLRGLLFEVHPLDPATLL
ncbi:MAG: ABC transporter permease, partial [Longimicrobiales bacterium]